MSKLRPRQFASPSYERQQGLSFHYNNKDKRKTVILIMALTKVDAKLHYPLKELTVEFNLHHVVNITETLSIITMDIARLMKAEMITRHFV